MKTILFSILLFSSILASAQNSQERIFVFPSFPNSSDVPVEACKQLEIKMKQCLSQNGISSTDPSNRFVMTCKPSVLTKNIVPGPPQKVSLTIDFNFIVGDAVEDNIYEMFTVNSIGVGTNETKAYIAAIKNIKTQNEDVKQFIKKAKEEIVNYYELRCEIIKDEAAKKAAAYEYQEAMYLLMQVPDVCDCSEECQTLLIKYYNEYIKVYSAELLNQAKSLWAAEPNADGAAKVADVIARVPGDTDRQNEFDELISEISSKLKADELREWEFKKKVYQDNLEKQRRDDAARLEQQRSDNAARRQYIEAARQVGIAYAQNRPKTITYQQNIIRW